MKNFLFLFLGILGAPFLFSQEGEQLEEDIDVIIDNIIDLDDDYLMEMITDLNKYQVIYASMDFNNRTYFLGRDLGLDQYNITTQLIYQNSNGIYAGIAGNYYDKFDPKWDLTVLTAGYGIDFGKKDNFRAELGYSRYIFSDASSNDFENSIDGSFYMSTNDNAFGSSINSSYLFGEKKGFQSSLSFFGDVKIFNINANNGSKISMNPDLSFIFGSENIDTSRIDNLGIDIPFVNRIVSSFETFDLRNIQLQIPLVLEFKNFNAEIGYNINFPKKLAFEDDLDNTSFFNVGLTYIFFIK